MMIGACAGIIGASTGVAVSAALVGGASGFLGGAIVGASSGFMGSFTSASMSGASFGEAIKVGLIGAGTGGVIGGLSSGISAVIKGYDFLYGSKVIGQLTSSQAASGQSYDKATLEAFGQQAKKDAKSLWNILTGERGLKDITTVLDGAAKKQGYTYRNGLFFDDTATAVDGFTIGYANGNSKVYISPDVVADRIYGVFSSYTVWDGAPTILSARYVATLGHELIHVDNWFTLSSIEIFNQSSEHAGYSFNKHVWRNWPFKVNEFNSAIKENGWIYHPKYGNNRIFKY